MKKHFIALAICLLTGIFYGYGQQDCSNALPICSDANSGGVVNGFGYDDFFGSSVSGCLRNGLGVTTIETNSYWFRFKLAAGGQFGFNITPNNLSEDWDFAVYGPNTACGALGAPIACNYSKASPTGYTGVGLDPVTNTQTEAYDSWMNVNAGDEYVILINQYSGNNSGFSINWKGAVITNNAAYLDCSILVNLGPDRNFCVGQNTQLNAKTFGPSISYEWKYMNTVTGLFVPFSPAKTGEAIFVNTTGTYQVTVTDNTTGIAKSDDILVTFHAIPTAGNPIDIVLCDTNGDGVETFNLASNSTAILNGQTGMTVTYHEFQTFAQVGAAPIISPDAYVSGGKTIWARIQNDANTNCFEVVSFNISAAPPPIANKPPDLKACDDDNDGFMIFNLDQQTPIILNGSANIVTYYDDVTKANDRKGWILNSNAYPSKTATIWVRVEPSVNSACYAITTFNLEVFEKAKANPTTNILQCDFDNDGLYQFDLRTKDAEILGSQSSSTFEINYFATQANANNNINVLPNLYTNVTPYAEERIYARIHNKGFVDCYQTTSFTLQVLDTAYPAAAANIPNLSYCDDASDGNDTNGFYQFNLTERGSVILNGQSPYVFEVNYYRDAAYMNKILNPTAFTNSVANLQTIYVRVINKTTNNVTCYADTSFLIEVKPLPIAMTIPYELAQCDEDGNPDGVTNFNLSEADFFVTLGNTNLNVSYHLSAINAASGINAVNKSSFSNGVSPTVFARVVATNGCYRIVQVNLTVTITSFPPTYSREIIFCDDDATIDGLHEFNLAKVTSEIISQFTSPNLRVGYYRNQADALLETNIISPANAYLSEVPYSQTIWVRVESAINGNCFGIAPVLKLTVNPRPQFELDETGIVCLNDLPKTISIYNPLGTYTYEWTNAAGDVISEQPFVDIFEAGVYTVIATSNLGCVSFPKQITMTESIIADISSEDIQVADNSGNNSITINNAGQNLGIGNYEFSLDDISGPYQDDPVFTEVIPGTHTVFVRDKNSCGIAQVTVYVFGFPNFFTPNDDGQNDTWNVLGVDPAVFKSSLIYIFDRYGKLMTSISASQQGWDGFYNSHKAVSTDYWYLAKMTDYSGNTSEHKGHFSLIRR
ncbi:MAG: T9SS type B sorting domain-containing protein [Lutibacter sp.]|nr:T9SS type B sorting domain-containing protein [Lutibacter sp.]